MRCITGLGTLFLSLSHSYFSPFLCLSSSLSLSVSTSLRASCFISCFLYTYIIITELEPICSLSLVYCRQVHRHTIRICIYMCDRIPRRIPSDISDVKRIMAHLDGSVFWTLSTCLSYFNDFPDTVFHLVLSLVSHLVFFCGSYVNKIIFIHIL